MDFDNAKKKAMEYGKKHGDKYDIAGETKDAYFFGKKEPITDNQDHCVFISKDTGRAISLSGYEKKHDGNVKFTGKPKAIAAEKKVKRK